jgi:hypothetical protein
MSKVRYCQGKDNVIDKKSENIQQNAFENSYSRPKYILKTLTVQNS